MTAIEIDPADTGRALRAFIDLPYRLHRGDPSFVPPLRRDQRALFDRERHPFFRHAEAAFFLARRDGRPAGRVEAIVNRAHNAFHGDRVGFFGAFESPDDPDVSAALLGAAASWLRDRGMQVMRGPATHSTNEECGLLIDGFGEPPMVGMPYNPPHYATLLEAFGLAKAKDLYAWEAWSTQEMPAKLRRVAEAVRRDTDVSIRPVNLSDYDGEIRRALDVYNGSWARNWGFVPLSPDEFRHAAEQIKPLIARCPDGVLIAEIDGHPAGFCLAVADVNQALARVPDGRLLPFGFWALHRGLRRVDQMRVMALGVLPEFRHRGVDALLYIELLTRGQRLGYRRAEFGWTLEDNHVMNRAMGMGARHYKTYRLYDLDLGAPRGARTRL